MKVLLQEEDWSINKKDLEVVKFLWGEKDYSFSWADVNEDSKVDILDLQQVLSAFKIYLVKVNNQKHNILS